MRTHTSANAAAVDQSAAGTLAGVTIFMLHSTIHPLGDRILVQFGAEQEQISGGILIPDSAREKPQEAKVIALGSGHREKDGTRSPFGVKVGYTVLLAKYGGTEVKLKEQKFTLVREDDILGVIG